MKGGVLTGRLLARGRSTGRKESSWKENYWKQGWKMKGGVLTERLVSWEGADRKESIWRGSTDRKDGS